MKRDIIVQPISYLILLFSTSCLGESNEFVENGSWKYDVPDTRKQKEDEQFPLQFIPWRKSVKDHETNELSIDEVESYSELRKNGLLHTFRQEDLKRFDGDRNSFKKESERLPREEQLLEVAVEADFSMFTVSEEYLSFNIDYELLDETEPWSKFNISSPRLVTLLKGLSPAIWRIGGSGSSYMFFDAKPKHLFAAEMSPHPIIFPKEALLGFVKASIASGNRFLLDLNQQSRLGSQWDPANSIEIFEFLVSHGFGDNIDFELGNEPEWSTAKGQILLKPDEIGNDFLILERVIRSYPEFAGSRIVGPDCVGVNDGSQGKAILNRVASIAGQSMRAITFHQYYFKGTEAKVKDYYDPRYFSALHDTILLVQEAVATSQHPLLPLWIGETSDSWHSGTENVTDRYVSGFLWLEKLGLAARMGIEVVMRQTFYCGNYGLVANNLQPNPDYWLSFVHKHLVGRNVLNVDLTSNSNSVDSEKDDPPTTRVYAHCTKLNNGDGLAPSYPPGSVTLIALNVSPNTTKSLQLPVAWRTSPTDVYLLSPPGGDLLSQQVELNGYVMQLISDTELPRLTPQTLPPLQPFTLPPLTFGFLVVPHAAAPACL